MQDGDIVHFFQCLMQAGAPTITPDYYYEKKIGIVPTATVGPFTFHRGLGS
jgi:hypothetical protein